jgi:hydrogenase-4 component B
LNTLSPGLLTLGAAALLLPALRSRRVVGLVNGAAALAAGSLLGFAAVRALAEPLVVRVLVARHLTFGPLALRLDPIAAVFLLPLAVIGPLCAIYGVAYLGRHGHARRPGSSMAMFHLLLLGMAVVLVADNLILFLIAWELMTLTSWALVVSDATDPAAHRAGLQYLVAAHLATAGLILLFLMMTAGSGSFEIGAQRAQTSGSALLFALALIGFGTKAGIVPFHVWLPDAHPAAPSHVSALMSAVLITMGFYGLARFLPLLGSPAWWWPYLLMGLGCVGAVGGVAFALAQNDVKRALAYSTVENAGIVTIAMGAGLLGTTTHQPLLAALGWTAALLHLWNHATAKALLFLGFGAIAQAAGSRSLDAHGGFLSRWPVTGGIALLGCVSLASMPGLNVFPGEWLLFRSLLSGTVGPGDAVRLALFGVIASLAFAGGLAVACFARIAGIALLGRPRSPGAAAAARPGPMMVLPLAILAAACVVFALVPARIAGALTSAAGLIAPAMNPSVAPEALRPVGGLAVLLMAMTAGVLALGGLARMRAVRRRATTWSCGHPAVVATMQYTATSFSEPITGPLHAMLGTRVIRQAAPDRTHPRLDTWKADTPDRLLDDVYRRVFRALRRGGERLREYHQPRVSRSLLYIVLTVLVLLGLLFMPVARR